MKRFSLLTILSFLCVYSINAQRFQVTTGTQTADEKWAVVEDSLPNGKGYIAIGNVTNTAGIRQVWISSYNSNGAVLSSALSTTGRNMIARDICLAPVDPTTNKKTYYVTGWTQVTNGTAIIHQMFVGRIRLDGSFVWYQENPIVATGNNIEGVAVALAPNGDAVAAGNTILPATGNFPGGSRITLSRFSSAGVIQWSRVYNQSGNWMVRELANGVPTPNCAASPTALPGEFVITGEVGISNVAGGSRPTTFVAAYNGAGTECWRNLYPVSTTALNVVADAGYDIVYNSATGNYAVAGVAQTGAIRASAASTPYLFEVSSSGVITIGAIYLGLNNNPMGLYPRSIARGISTPGTAGTQLVIAGPDFGNNKTFMARMPAIGTVGAFNRYNGLATANSLAQPFVLNDAQPESVLYTQATSKPGYLVSTNSFPVGAFGLGDGHFIRTDLLGQTPDACSRIEIPNQPLQTKQSTGLQSVPIDLQNWGSKQLQSFNYPVQQRFCNDTCAVSSSYTFTQSGGTVSFTGTGSGNGTISYLWNFGDGSTSTLQNPSHIFTSPGSYTVCLSVINTNSAGDTCSSITCKTIVVQKPCDVKGGFKYSVACKYKVTFTNTSTGTGPFTYKWIFDDGSISTSASPIKTFATCGIKRVYMIVCNSVCCDTIAQNIEIPCCKVVSDFCLQDSGLYVKLLYNTAMNQATTTYTVYVDGVPTSWLANSSKLLTAGVHTICLKARRVSCPGDTCCSTCCKTINVHANCTLAADFWYQVQSTGNVLFTNKTTPAGFTSVWDFGDGSPTVTTASPSHIYTTPGIYNACLTTTIITGTDTCRSRICKSITIVAPCKVSAKFKSKFCLATPLTVEFINSSTGATGYLWNFGDGSIATSTGANTVHTYNAAGTYIVCLTAFAGDNCWSKSCFRVVVSSSSCDSSCSSLPKNPTFKVGQDLLQPGEILNDMSPEGSVNFANGTTRDNTNALKAQPEQTKEIVADKLSLFPNPATQRVQVVFETASEAKGEITISNALGSLVYRMSVNMAEGKNQFSVPLNSFANGNYFLRINSGSKIHSMLFSVKH